MNNETHLTPAPYKQSFPQQAERVKPIDGAALRKESWILGQCPETYSTVNQQSFHSPKIDPSSRKNNAEQVRLVRHKVASSSIKNECTTEMSASTMYKTNSAVVHSDKGMSDVITREMRNAQRDKLTKANFSMGYAPNFYATQNNMNYVPMRGQAHSMDVRKKAADSNRRTNFISQSDRGFEAPAKKFDYGTVPDKGMADTSQVASMIDNLRKEHFKLGE